MHPILTRTIDAVLLPTLAVGAIMAVGMTTDYAWRAAAERSPKPGAIVVNVPAGYGWRVDARRRDCSSWIELDSKRPGERGTGTSMNVVDPPAFEADIMVTVLEPMSSALPEATGERDERSDNDGDL